MARNGPKARIFHLDSQLSAGDAGINLDTKRTLFLLTFEGEAGACPCPKRKGTALGFRSQGAPCSVFRVPQGPYIRLATPGPQHLDQRVPSSPAYAKKAQYVKKTLRFLRFLLFSKKNENARRKRYKTHVENRPGLVFVTKSAFSVLF